jgi:hypothetical protein
VRKTRGDAADARREARVWPPARKRRAGSRRRKGIWGAELGAREGGSRPPELVAVGHGGRGRRG